jgi:hypothetical protein
MFSNKDVVRRKNNNIKKYQKRYFIPTQGVFLACYLSSKEEKVHVLDQANMSAWWMPWHQESTKDAISCEKLRVAANRL